MGQTLTEDMENVHILNLSTCTINPFSHLKAAADRAALCCSCSLQMPFYTFPVLTAFLVPLGFQKVKQKNTNFSAADESVIFNQLMGKPVPDSQNLWEEGKEIKVLMYFSFLLSRPQALF